MRTGHSRRLLVCAVTLLVLAVPAAGATAASLDTSAVGDVGLEVPSPSVPQPPSVAPDLPSAPSTPSVPTVPSVPSPTPSVPSLPSTPSLPTAPSLPPTPSLPSTPSLPGSGDLIEAAPSPTAAEAGTAAPSTSPVPGTQAAAEQEQDGGSGDGSSQSGGAESGPGGQAQGPPSRAERRAERFEEKVRALRGCLAVLPPRQWSFAVMRTGIYSGLSLSRVEVARRTELSRQGVRRLERKVLQALLAAKRAHGCDGVKAPAATDAGEMSSLILTGSVPTAASLGDAAESPSPAEAAGDEDGDGGTEGRSAVAGVFESGSMPVGIGVSLLQTGETLSSVAVAVAILLLVAAALHLYRRRMA